MLTSENKMSRIEAHKFHVIQFLDKQYTGTLDYVCVPRSWVQPNDDEDDPLVNVWYSDEDHKYTERRVRKRKNKSSQWKSFLSVVKFSTNDYEVAKSYVLKQINQEKKQGDHTISETVKENKAKIDNEDHQTTNWCVSSKSPNCLTIKRKLPQKPEKENLNKRSRKSELDESDVDGMGSSDEDVVGSSDEDVVGSSSQAHKNKANHLSRNHEFSDEDLGTYEIHIEKSNDSHNSEYRPTVNRDPSKANQSLDTETLTKLMQFANLTLELKKVMGNEHLKQLLNKILNTDDSHCSQNKYTIASAPRDITAGVPKFNKKKINEEQPKEKDVDIEPTKNKKSPKLKFSKPLQRKSGTKRFKDLFGSSDSDEEIIDDADKYEEPFKEKCSPKRAKKVVLPPDYVENDSRWTIKYRESKQGLVELEEGTGVYVSAARLSYYKEYSKDGTVFALWLLDEIFTKSALSTCSWTGAKAGAYDRDGTNIRPGLNLAARKLLLRYASDHAKMKGWPNWDTKILMY